MVQSSYLTKKEIFRYKRRTSHKPNTQYKQAMKTKLLVFTLCSIFIFVSCNKDEDYTPNSNVVNAFNNRFPDAKDVSWKIKAGYHMADFINGSYEAEAWYDDSGNWIATETELPFKSLPMPVQESFNFSKYKTWTIDNVSKLEREQAPMPLYIIEAENNKMEVTLSYAAEGKLVKETVGKDDEGFQPITIPTAIKEYITKNYPGATILDYDRVNTEFEVEILHNFMYIEVLFDKNNQWISSSWPTTFGLLPEVISSAYNASEYANNYEIDEILQVEKPTGTFFQFELEQNDNDILVTFNAEGMIVNP